MSDAAKGCGAGCGLIIGIFAVGGLLFCALVGGCLMVASNREVANSPNLPNDHKETPPPTSTPDPIKPDKTPQEDSKDPHKDEGIDRLNMINYNRVDDGMTYDEVRSILGPASEEAASSRFGQGTEFDTKTVILVWKGSWGANCNVTFQNGRVVAKAQFGLKVGKPTPDLVSQVAERRREAIERQAKADEERAKAEEQAMKERKAREEELAKAKEDERAAIEEAKWRTWTDTSGTFKTEAKFKSLSGDSVRLEKRDGTLVSVPVEKLSDADKKWLTEYRNKGTP